MTLLPNRLCLLLALFPLVSCNEYGDASASEGTSSTELERHQATKVRVAEVVRKEMVKKLITSREVESENQIELFPRAQGIVTELFVEEGDSVEAGQVLGIMDQRDAKAAVEEAKIGVEDARDNVEKSQIAKREAEAAVTGREISRAQAERDYKRNEKAKLISGQDLENLKLTWDTAISDHEQAKLALDRAIVEARAAGTATTRAELALERAEVALSYTEIVAPISGVISRRSIKVGDSVSSAAAAFTLTDHESLIVVFPRPQRELPLFSVAANRRADGTESLDPAAPALEIVATAEALPGSSFRGEIIRISPAIDPENGSFRVTAKLEQPTLESGEPRLLPGMLVRLEIVTDRHLDTLVVPKRSLRREGELDILFAIENGTARRVEVEEGFSNDDEIEVRPRDGHSLTVGEQVVIVGNRDLEDGAKVEVEGQETPTHEEIESPSVAEDSEDAESEATENSEGE